MAQTPESKVKAQIKSILDKHGAYHFSPFQAGMGRAGIPDIIASYKGHFVAIEAKAGNNKPTGLQLREIQKIKDSGGHALVINEANIDTLSEYLIKLGEK